MDYKAIFFDWDGTLVHHSKLISEGHSHVRAHFGLDAYDQKEAFTRGHQSTRELYPVLYGDRWEEAEKLFYDFFFENHLNDVNPFEDTKPLLEGLLNREIPMGVVSNKKHLFLTREIEHIDWNHYFASIVGAGEAKRDKPSGEPIKYAVNLLSADLKNQDILYVGDTETDMKSSNDFGCDCALITRGRDMKDLIEQHRPKHVFDSYTEMSELLGISNKIIDEKKAC